MLLVLSTGAISSSGSAASSGFFTSSFKAVTTVKRLATVQVKEATLSFFFSHLLVLAFLLPSLLCHISPNSSFSALESALNILPL